MLYPHHTKSVAEILKEIKVIDNIEDIQKFYDSKIFMFNIFKFEEYLKEKHKNHYNDDISLSDNVYNLYGCLTELIVYCIFLEKDCLKMDALFSYRWLESKGEVWYPFRNEECLSEEEKDILEKLDFKNKFSRMKYLLDKQKELC